MNRALSPGVDLRVDVAVVGGGASGTLTAAWLLRLGGQSGKGLKVALIERDARLGAGVAYGTRRREHLLNVPAGRMSADPADPLHFVRWAKARVRGAAPANFLPRRLYGVYLRSFLDAAESSARGGELVRVRGEVVRLQRDEGEHALSLKSGAVVRARWVVLATGNPAPEPLPGVADALRARGAVVEDPWRGALGGPPARGVVVLAGSGLTAADAIATLHAAGFRGRIVAISRHGLLPRPHLAVAPVAPGGLPRERTLRALLGWLRRSGDAWRSALDVLRPQSAALWRGLSPRERARFLRHLRARWDVHRHRVPPAVNAVVRALLASGRLQVVKGQVVGAAVSGSRMRVKVRRRGGTAVTAVEADLVVNCTGPTPAGALRSPLMRGLLEDGLASVDGLGLGLRTRGGALLDRAGRAVPRLLAVGPLRRAELWETTAIPEIREQAQEVAARILGKAAERSAPAEPAGRAVAARR